MKSNKRRLARMATATKRAEKAFAKLHDARMAFVEAHEAMTPADRKEFARLQGGSMDENAWRAFGDCGA